MSVLLVKILWYQLTDRGTEIISDNQYGDPINITDAISLDAAKAIDIQNNILSFMVRNPHSFYVNEFNDIKFSEQDQIKLFLKQTDDPNDIGLAVWDVSTISEPATEYLVGVYYIVDFSTQHTPTGTLINLKCADKTYILFNKILAKAFTKKENLTAPEVIQKIIRFSSQTGDRTGYIGSSNEKGVFYDIDAKLQYAENGYITDIRRSTREDGTTNTDTNFPKIEIAKVWKPIYEWVAELSQPEKTNSISELAGDSALTYGRPFIFWVDESNQFHWVYPTDTVADYIEVGKFMDETLSYDSTKTNKAEVFNINVSKKIFDVTNMIIFNGGTDMYGTGIWAYVLDTTSNVKTLKMRVVPMTDIAEKWKNKDYDTVNGTAQANRKGTPAGTPKYQFPLDARYPLSDVDGNRCAFVGSDLTTYKTDGSITNDSTYNSALRERCTFEAEGRASSLIKGLSHARWKGSITVKGKIYTVGNLVEFTNTAQGIYKEKLRILEVRHNLNSGGWSSELSLEEDAQALVTTARINN